MSRETSRFVTLVTFLATTVFALYSASTRAEPVATGATIVTLNPTSETLRVPSAAPVRLTLLVSAAAGAKLNLRADLLQVAAGGLAAPLLHDLLVADALEFGARDNGRRLVEFTLPAAPNVQRPGRFLLRFRVQDPGEADWRPAGTATLLVYPDERVEWKKRLAEGLQRRGWRLSVFGSNPNLRRFLRERDVSFEDAGGDKPSELNPNRLYLGESASAKALDSSLVSLPLTTSPAKLILLLPPSAEGLPPGVYSSRNAAGGVLIKVTLPLLDRLADDPSAQHLLAEVLRQALEFPAPATVQDPDSNSSP